MTGVSSPNSASHGENAVIFCSLPVPFPARYCSVMHVTTLKWLCVLTIALTLPGGAALARESHGPEPAPPAAREELPVDPRVHVGSLGNGVSYYVRENTEPENRAFFRLVVNAGSVLEDEDQLGLAHFVEHMAFLGTERFDKDEIDAYLESLGIRFGPDVNAYTSFDETVYMLQIPADDPEKLETGIHILQQWAHAVTFEPELIESERGVIQEEWRTRLGARQRIRDQQLPVLLYDSRYAVRLPIGRPEIFMEAGREELKRFYEDWYRPELVAVVAVGDFDGEQIRDWISEYFGPIDPHPEPRQRERYEVPHHHDTLYTMVSDPEAAQTTITLYSKHGAQPLRTEAQYREVLEDRLFAIALNNRFSELSREPDAPFLRAVAGRGRLVRPVEARILQAIVEEDAILPGFHALMTEAARARQHGFTEAEVERARRELRRRMQNAYNERENTPSSAFVLEYTRHYLQGEAIPGIEKEWELTQRFLPQIDAEVLHERAEKFFRHDNRVIAISAAETPELAMPSREELEDGLTEIAALELDPLLDEKDEQELMTTRPEPGEISAERRLEAVDAVEWVLPNGITVVAKPTDFRSDEIRLAAFRYGGASLVEDADYRSARFAPDVADASGVERFSRTELDRILAGRDVSLSAYMNRYDHGFEGRSSVDDLEQLFQLLHLNVLSPRVDESAFETVMRRERSQLRNRQAQPTAAFIDRIVTILADGDVRRAPLKLDDLEAVEFARLEEMYRSLYTDMSGLKVFLVGAFDIETLRDYVEAYLAGLPAQSAKSERVPRDASMPRGVIEDELYIGSDPASRVGLVFTGAHNWSREENYAFQSLADALRLELREVIRERESGTYSVSVAGSLAQYPQARYQFSILFGTSPERAAPLAELVIDELRGFAEAGPSESLVSRVRETHRREHESNLRSNRFWIQALRNGYYYDDPIDRIPDYPELVESLDAGTIRAAAQRYLDLENYIRVILYPADRE